jgi:hypothetical protein
MQLGLPMKEAASSGGNSCKAHRFGVLLEERRNTMSFLLSSAAECMDADEGG